MGRKFYHYSVALKRHFLPATAVCFTFFGTTIFQLRSQPIWFKAESKILVKQKTNNENFPQLDVSKNSSSLSLLSPEEIIRSPLIWDQAGTKIVAKEQLFAGRLQVQALPKTDILRVTYTASEAEVAAQIVNELISVYQEVAAQKNIAHVRIIAPALIPGQPISRYPKPILLVSIFFGSILGWTSAIWLDYLSMNIKAKTLEQTKKLFTDYTLLGVIPLFDKSGQACTNIRSLELNIPRVIVRDLPESPMQEAYQMLQSNLKFTSPDKLIKSITITSAAPHEGKSEVAANLAATIASKGRKVLLIDANLRQPIQHYIWHQSNQIGLTSTVKKKTTLTAAIKEVMPRLDLLTCGIVSSNPMSLLNSPEMIKLVRSVYSYYDIIIFDTPSLRNFADAMIVSDITDGILIVTRPQIINPQVAQAAQKFLNRQQKKILGFVVNGINIMNEPDSYFYYRSFK